MKRPEIQFTYKTLPGQIPFAPFRIEVEDFRMSQDCAFVCNCSRNRSGAFHCTVTKPLVKRLLYLLKLRSADRVAIEVFPNLDYQIAFSSRVPARQGRFWHV
jgi:hypothetical protein